MDEYFSLIFLFLSTHLELKTKREGRRSFEEVLGLLIYVACRIHRYPWEFEEIEERIKDFYGEEIEKRKYLEIWLEPSAGVQTLL